MIGMTTRQFAVLYGGYRYGYSCDYLRPPAAVAVCCLLHVARRSLLAGCCCPTAVIL